MATEDEWDEGGSFSQPGLISAILGYFDRCKLDLNERQLNAVIRAATDIFNEMYMPNRPATAGMGLHAWLSSDDTGVSSRYMASVLAEAAGMGYVPRSHADRDPYPYDPADFGRCVRLLDAVPDLRGHMSALADDTAHGPVWNAVAAEWDTLEAWYREDLPTGRSQRLFERLNAIREGVQRGQ